MSSALSDAGSTAGTRRPKEDKSLRIAIAAPRTSRPASQGNEERGGTRGKSPGALLPPSSCRIMGNGTARGSNVVGRTPSALAYPTPRILFISVQVFFPQVIWGLRTWPCSR